MKNAMAVEKPAKRRVGVTHLIARGKRGNRAQNPESTKQRREEGGREEFVPAFSGQDLE